MKKSMEENFQLLYAKIKDTNDVSDLNHIKEKLSEISGNVICVGSGGSGVVSEFASAVLSEKNNCLTVTKEFRDLLYDKSVKLYQELFICSYYARNYGIQASLNNKLSKKILTMNEKEIPGVDMISFASTLEEEDSFVSLSDTLVPISLLLNYYLDGENFDALIDDIMCQTYIFHSDHDNHNFEIMSGFDTRVAAKYLESTLVEGGLGMAVVHDKYDYCHGRTSLSYHNPGHTLIYLKMNDSELEQLLLEETKNLYHNVIVLESRYDDSIVGQFDLLVQSMYLTKEIAEFQNKDLSNVKYAQAVKKLYFFNGKM